MYSLAVPIHSFPTLTRARLVNNWYFPRQGPMERIKYKYLRAPRRYQFPAAAAAVAVAVALLNVAGSYEERRFATTILRAVGLNYRISVGLATTSKLKATQFLIHENRWRAISCPCIP
jgi:hypothetical protein